MKMDAESERCLAPTSTSVVITTEATLAQNDNHHGQSLPCGNTIFKVWIDVVVYSYIYYSEYIYIFFSDIPASVLDENMMSNINFSDTNDIDIAFENGDVWLQEMIISRGKVHMTLRLSKFINVVILTAIS